MRSAARRTRAGRRASTSVTKNGSAVTEIENTASAATAPPRAIARSRSRNRNAKPSRARTGSSSAAARAAAAPAAASAVTPTTTNESALIASASRSSPAAPSAPPTSGPAVKPSERTVSISPLARATSPPAGRRRHERELRRLADRDAEAEQRHQRQQRPQLVGARDHPGDHRRLGERDDDRARARFSKRSTIAPASPAARTTGPHSAKTSAETANAEPVLCCTCRISGKTAMKSPRAERPAAPARRRRSRDMAAMIRGARSPTARAA